MSDPISGPYCGRSITGGQWSPSLPANASTVVDTYGSDVTLGFRSDAYSQTDKSGFVVRVNASVDGCGGTLEGSGGVLESPGYPNGYPHKHYCRWFIM